MYSPMAHMLSHFTCSPISHASLALAFCLASPISCRYHATQLFNETEGAEGSLISFTTFDLYLDALDWILEQRATSERVKNLYRDFSASNEQAYLKLCRLYCAWNDYSRWDVPLTHDAGYSPPADSDREPYSIATRVNTTGGSLTKAGGTIVSKGFVVDGIFEYDGQTSRSTRYEDNDSYRLSRRCQAQVDGILDYLFQYTQGGAIWGWVNEQVRSGLVVSKQRLLSNPPLFTRSSRPRCCRTGSRRNGM
jgi:hypothetical protein